MTCVVGTGHRVEGNLIGTDASGTVAVPNLVGGVSVSTDCAIGGSATGEGNVISGNRAFGVRLSGGSSASVEGNLIGADAGGSAALPNEGPGVLVTARSDHTIGGTADGAGNLITANTGSGVVIEAGLSHRILGNSIFENEGMGIDLGTDGVTVNDGAGDPDAGANNLQNFPVLSRADTGLSETVIQVAMVSTARTTFGLELFASESCDVSGCGEGQMFLGSVDVTTSNSGESEPSTIILPTAVPVGYAVTATATDPEGNTSEFSECFVVSACTFSEFGQTVLAPDENTLAWGAAEEVNFVRGPISGLSTYAITGSGALSGATSLDISGDIPGGEMGLYYLLRLQDCGSWQTTVGAEQERDGILQ